MSINIKDISVIVQGPINKKETPKCLKSIRKFLPGAEIILSTWNGEDLTGLDYDILVLNDAPEAVLIEKRPNKAIYNNMNRQLLSIQAGLKKANRKYAMKLRSDLILTSDKFLTYFDKFQERISDYHLFERKVLISALFTRYNLKLWKETESTNTPFHISDWYMFGLREDLNTYFFNTPLVKEPEFTNYFKLEENKTRKSPYKGMADFKFAPEQYFGYECFARNFNDIYMKDCADYNNKLMEQSRKCIVNNFIVLEFKQSGICLNKYYCSKHEKLSGEQYLDLYNFYKYESEYKKYCDSNYKITTQDLSFNNEKIKYSLLKLYKHLAYFTKTEASVFNKLEQLFIGIPVSAIRYAFTIISEKLL